MPDTFDFSAPNTAIDLTTLSLVRDYLGIQSGKADSIIQLCITAASIEWIWRTGRGLEGDVPTASAFVAPVEYTEKYDGTGGFRQFLRNWPIRSVSRVLINGSTSYESTGFGMAGWMIDSSQKSLVMRPPSRSSRARGCGGFSEGIQNIEVTYTAGYVQIPPDVIRAATQMVGVNYRRTEWLDFASKSTSNNGITGTTSYRSWAIPPEVKAVMNLYTRDLPV